MLEAQRGGPWARGADTDCTWRKAGLWILQGPPSPSPASAHCSQALLPVPTPSWERLGAKSQQEKEHPLSRCFPQQALCLAQRHTSHPRNQLIG